MDAFVEAFLKACPQPPPPLPVPASSPDPPVTLRKAAVLIPLFVHPQDDQIHCLLTVRPSHMRSHAGEVCLPGGKIDEEDADAVAAALREAEEEIGLPRGHEGVRVVGLMTPTLSLHLMEVTPVVAVIPADFVPRPNPEEVEVVFSCPLELILSPPAGCHSYQDLHWFLPWRMHTFRHETWDVWGLTGECLLRLALLCHPERPFPYDTRHPDGTDMEDWFGRVLALPSFHAEARAAAEGRRRRAGSRRKKNDA